ncbi:hypothetical protein [Algisphaera agarilytica]|uniref:Uncharacterized protein n=1 Tax=Algisphaera agarilytica TaxID=1385975 RepID=A0A7X0H5U5_9BACT|nr:hypothetical protein [Algisphaera agarilytica]MBB6429784.1 hypothetical protein [Algisphaera agarilytica]
MIFNRNEQGRDAYREQGWKLLDADADADTDAPIAVNHKGEEVRLNDAGVLHRDYGLNLDTLRDVDTPAFADLASQTPGRADAPQVLFRPVMRFRRHA